MRIRPLAVTAALIVAVAGVTPTSADAAMPHKWKNCTIVNKRLPHGVGRNGAHDHVTSGTPVTNFRRDNAMYNAAMRANRGLDRDHDGIACEKQ